MSEQETCDRCGPSTVAKFEALLRSGRILTYCGHCSTRFRAGIEAQGGVLCELEPEEVSAV